MDNRTDKLAIRFLYIITQLNSGEKLTTRELALKFDVTERIIQKDLNERLNQFLPITKENGKYFLESFLIGKLGYEDIKNFAILSGIKKLYPSLEDSFLSDVLNKKINDSCLVRGASYEDISDKQNEFDLIRLAITIKHQLTFTYNDKQRVISPYKLVNNDDIWYLVGDEKGKLKTYSFTKISSLLKTENKFIINRDFLEIINKNQANWFSQDSINVILEINADVSEYFLRRELLPNQTILKNTKTKLIIQTKVSYDNEILKVVRYWIPHIQILEPEYLQIKLLNELQLYINS
jgi:predicted DNA-binding transcriptional regulator YafY